MDLARRRHWIFDLDGTLTLAVHDFEDIRRTLGLPAGRPILEAVAERPPEEARSLTARLDALEAGLVTATSPAPGAHELLVHLQAQGCRLGILTRNTLDNARATLAHCGLDGFFAGDAILGREEAPPKPSPVGILRLLSGWSAAPASGVMVGDFRFDLEAGRAAGVATVSVDPSGAHPHGALADHRVDHLAQLVPATPPGPATT